MSYAFAALLYFFLFLGDAAARRGPVAEMAGPRAVRRVPGAPGEPASRTRCTCATVSHSLGDGCVVPRVKYSLPLLPSIVSTYILYQIFYV